MVSCITRSPPDQHALACWSRGLRVEQSIKSRTSSGSNFHHAQVRFCTRVPVRMRVELSSRPSAILHSRAPAKACEVPPNAMLHEVPPIGVTKVLTHLSASINPHFKVVNVFCSGLPQHRHDARKHSPPPKHQPHQPVRRGKKNRPHPR